MTQERYLWWIVLAWCVWRSWTANRKADAAANDADNPNETGSRILAALVGKLDEARRFVGSDVNWRVEATNTFRVRNRRFRVTIIEIAQSEDDPS